MQCNFFWMIVPFQTNKSFGFDEPDVALLPFTGFDITRSSVATLYRSCVATFDWSWYTRSSRGFNEPEVALLPLTGFATFLAWSHALIYSELASSTFSVVHLLINFLPLRSFGETHFFSFSRSSWFVWFAWFAWSSYICNSSKSKLWFASSS